MAVGAIVWDETGSKLFETGVDHCILYDVNKTTTGDYPKDKYFGINGVAWNGITGVTESPSGAEDTDFYADNIKYGSMKSAEDFGATITAYTYPDEWEKHDGSADILPGVKISQQEREPFGLFYRTKIGNDTEGTNYGYRYHLVYGGTANPSQRSYKTINNSPEANEFSWEIKTTPVNVTDKKATSCLTIDSTDFKESAAQAKLDKLLGVLCGTATTEPMLPLPDEVKAILTSN